MRTQSCRAPRAAVIALLPALLGGGMIFTMRPALAHTRPVDDTYTLQRVYKMGDIDRYAFKIQTSVNNPSAGGLAQVKIEMVMKETTRDVKPDGSATLHDEFESASADLGDQKVDVTAFLPQITQTRDPQGKVSDVKIEGGSIPGGNASMFTGLAQTQQAFYPTKPVKVGDSWDIIYKNDKSDHPISVTGTATVESVETVLGMQTLKIKIKTDTTASVDDPAAPGTKKDVKSHFEGDSNIDVKSGKLVQMIGKIVNDPQAGGTSNLSMILKTGDDKTDKKPADAKP